MMLVDHTVGTLKQGYPLLLQQGRTCVVIRNCVERRSSQVPRARHFPHQANGPGPFPAWGWVRRRHVSLRKGSSELTTEARTPIGVRDLLRPSGLPSPCRGPEPPRVPKARDRARVFRRETRPPTAFNVVDKACSAAAVRKTAFVRPR